MIFLTRCDSLKDIADGVSPDARCEEFKSECIGLIEADREERARGQPNETVTAAGGDRDEMTAFVRSRDF